MPPAYEETRRHAATSPGPGIQAPTPSPRSPEHRRPASLASREPASPRAPVLHGFNQAKRSADEDGTAASGATAMPDATATATDRAAHGRDPGGGLFRLHRTIPNRDQDGCPPAARARTPEPPVTGPRESEAGREDRDRASDARASRGSAAGARCPGLVHVLQPLGREPLGAVDRDETQLVLAGVVEPVRLSGGT